MAGLYKRGKTWWARAQRKNREYRRSLKTANREVAEKRLRAWLEELDATAFGEKPRRSYVEAEARFIGEYLPTIKLTSAKRYGVSLKNLSETFGGKMLHEIGSGLLSEFETRRRGDGVRPGTIRRDLACLSSLMTAAIEWEWIDANPVPAYLKRRAKRGLKEAPPRTRYLSEAEEAKLLPAASPDVARDIMLAIDTGLRQDELFSLTWGQVNFIRGVITTTTRTKNGRVRPVPMPARSAQILAQLPRGAPSDFVLINPDTGTRFTQHNKGLAAAIRRAGIPRLSWHDLRRTAGCRWLQRDGKSMEEVSILLGHSSVLVTEQRYAFLEGEAVAESLSGRTKTGTWDSAVIPISKGRQ
jgi:integrase